MMYYFATEAFDIKKKPAEAVYYTEVLDSRNAFFTRMHHEPVLINPAVEDQFRGIVRQAYDYSCGSAALTTLINGYVGAQLTDNKPWMACFAMANMSELLSVVVFLYWT